MDREASRLVRIRRLFYVAATVCLTVAATTTTGATVAQQSQEQPAPEPVVVAGKWTMAMEMSMGTASVELEFKQEGEKVTGTYTGSYGAFPLEGVLKGHALEFAVYTTIEGQESTMSFSGEVAEDRESISGTAVLGQMGEAGWLAKRAK